ncbi:10154_t:CDS:2 [Ambispora gerdemannii]|uniref:10154_t:CDS:1 n=1 Tax=Ambispora gerdemannii TaxID=144530 RepID=A0A9N9CDL3_9GLOM|nr:10154_t:CDS:2 [Ambispora gerdemannii]
MVEDVRHIHVLGSKKITFKPDKNTINLLLTLGGNNNQLYILDKRDNCVKEQSLWRLTNQRWFQITQKQLHWI